MNFLLARLLRLERKHKRAVQLCVDAGLIVFSFALAMALRLESFRFIFDVGSWAALGVVLPVTLIAFVKLGLYHAVIRYISVKAIQTTLIGIFFSAVVLLTVAQAFSLPVPRSVPAIYALLAFVMIGGVRFVMRQLFARQGQGGKGAVILYGAGASGLQVLSALQRGKEYAPVAFVDDDASLHGTYLNGLRVCAPSDLPDLVARFRVGAVLLTMPSATHAKRKAVLARLEPLPVRVQTIPGMADIVSGMARISEFRDITVEDLLGRDPVPPRDNLMSANIRGKVVMVSGAGGSIGSELCRQIIAQHPATLVLYEMSEPSLYEIERELRGMAQLRGIATRIVPLLGSVQNARRVLAALQRFSVQTVYHAAAYKHVPLVELNVAEGIRNNVFGTLTLANAAFEAGVEAFILISTDKAVRPTNVMGASKRMAELVCQAFAGRQSGTRFSMVRFGNVLDSSGSVVPLFRAQIAAGGPVTVTHPEITRYFMTIPEAAQLVIQAGAMAAGGDVFVLDMGQPIHIVDLAIRMVRLAGLRPFAATDTHAIAGLDAHEGDIEIAFNGLRPGEKLYEELLIGKDARPTEHPRIMTANEQFLHWDVLESLLAELDVACNEKDVAAIRAMFRKAPTGYQPSAGVVDLLWNALGPVPKGDLLPQTRTIR